MKYNITILRKTHSFLLGKVGARFELLVNDIPINGAYTLHMQKKSPYSVYYNLRLNKSISKHPDYKNLRIAILEKLNEVYIDDTGVRRHMSPELWRTKLDKKKT